MDTCDLLVVNAAELVTVPDPGHAKGGSAQGELGLIPKGAVAIGDGKILEVGPTEKLLTRWQGERIIEATGKTVLPGLVDCHTHLPFAGSREHELQWKLEGQTYAEILAKGGGILSTVKATRKASEAELTAQTRARLTTMLAHGTTTAEAKSGYGLETKTELKQLRVIRDLENDTKQPIGLVPTFLGAHAFPPEMDKDDYIQLIVEEMLPKVAAEGLAGYCDVFCEEGVYTVAQSREILLCAKDLGLGLRIHADEFAASGGSQLAAELGVASADHLEFTTPKTMEALRNKGTVAVLLPGTPFVLFSNKHPDARTMVDKGLPVALASDVNPNCYCESMLMTLQMGVYLFKLTPAEALVAATLNPSHSLGLSDRGSLAPGKRADLLITDVPNHLHLAYHFGVNPVSKVIVEGQVVLDRGSA